jgi:hypothetical protein
MKAAWRCEKGHLVCQWSGVGEHALYSPPWMQAAENVNPRTPAPAFLYFTRLSPFPIWWAEMVRSKSRLRESWRRH